MWLQPKDRPVMMCPTLSFSLHLWDRLVKSYGFKSPHTPMAPLVLNPTFTSGLHPHTFAWWTNKGLQRIADLCDHSGILSKDTLRDKYQLPNSEFFCYFQIAHFLKSLQRTSDITTSTPMECCVGLLISTLGTFLKFIQ